MGFSYFNAVVVGAERTSLARRLTSLKIDAAMGPSNDGPIVIGFNRGRVEWPDSLQSSADIAVALTEGTSSTAFAIECYDDDILFLACASSGRVLNNQITGRDPFGGAITSSLPPKVGDGSSLAVAFSVDAVANELDQLLAQRVSFLNRIGVRKKQNRSLRPFDFESERHAAICRLLRLPQWTVGWDHNDAIGGRFPVGLDAKEFTLFTGWKFGVLPP